MIQKTKQEIINETAAFYNKGNRGLDAGGYMCKYITAEGNMCGVGRCLTEEGLDIFRVGVGSVNAYVSREGYLFPKDYLDYSEKKIKFENCLKEEYRGHSKAFWVDIQWFHDKHENWTEKGLSERGAESKYYLLNKVATNSYSAKE